MQGVRTGGVGVQCDEQIRRDQQPLGFRSGLTEVRPCPTGDRKQGAVIAGPHHADALVEVDDRLRNRGTRGSWDALGTGSATRDPPGCPASWRWPTCGPPRPLRPRYVQSTHLSPGGRGTTPRAIASRTLRVHREKLGLETLGDPQTGKRSGHDRLHGCVARTGPAEEGPFVRSVRQPAPRICRPLARRPDRETRRLCLAPRRQPRRTVRFRSYAPGVWSVRSSSTSSIFAARPTRFASPPVATHITRPSAASADSSALHRRAAIDQPDIAPEQTGLHAGDGVGADGLPRTLDLHTGKLGRAFEQGIGGDAESRRDRSTDIVAILVDTVEGRRGSEVDHDERPPVATERRNRVHDPVRAHLPGIVGPNPHTGLDAPTDDQLLVEVARQAFSIVYSTEGTTQEMTAPSTSSGPRPRCRRSSGAGARTHRWYGAGGDPPPVDDAVPAKRPEHGVRVSDVDDQQGPLGGASAHDFDA